MVQCEVCGGDLQLEFQCERCGGTYCSSHRLPEKHDCPPLPTGSSERWFSEKFEETDETVRRGDASDSEEGEGQSPPNTPREEPDQNPSGRSMPEYDGDETPATPYAPSSKPAPTSSSPDVNPDGSIAAESKTSATITHSDTGTDSTLSRRAWTIILLVLLIPFAAGAGALVMDPATSGDGGDSNAAAGVSTETATPTPAESATSQVGATSSLNVTVVRFAVHGRVNEIRTERGLEALEYHDRTAESAQDHAEWMAETGEFEHSGTNQYLCRAGENIAYTYADTDVRTENGTVNHYGNETSIGYGLVRIWMNSEEGHRENLLDDENKFEGIGIAVRETPDGMRVYAVQAICKS